VGRRHRGVQAAPGERRVVGVAQPTPRELAPWLGRRHRRRVNGTFRRAWVALQAIIVALFVLAAPAEAATMGTANPALPGPLQPPKPGSTPKYTPTFVSETEGDPAVWVHNPLCLRVELPGGGYAHYEGLDDLGRARGVTARSSWPIGVAASGGRSTTLWGIRAIQPSRSATFGRGTEGALRRRCCVQSLLDPDVLCEDPDGVGLVPRDSISAGAAARTRSSSSGDRGPSGRSGTSRSS